MGGRVGRLGVVGTMLTSVENLTVTALELEPSSHLDSVYRVLFLVLHIGIGKLQSLSLGLRVPQLIKHHGV